MLECVAPECPQRSHEKRKTTREKWPNRISFINLLIISQSVDWITRYHHMEYASPLWNMTGILAMVCNGVGWRASLWNEIFHLFFKDQNHMCCGRSLVSSTAATVPVVRQSDSWLASISKENSTNKSIRLQIWLWFIVTDRSVLWFSQEECNRWARWFIVVYERIIIQMWKILVEIIGYERCLADAVHTWVSKGVLFRSISIRLFGDFREKTHSFFK